MPSGRLMSGVAVAVLLAGGVGRVQGAEGQREGGKAAREISGDHLEQTVRCEGRGLVITANDSRIAVMGPCTEVQVAGSRNWVSVGAAERIVTTGDRNTVEYTERRTRVSDRGKANTVAEKYAQ